MAGKSEMLAALRGALAGTDAQATESELFLDVVADVEGVAGADWEIQIAIEKSSDLSLRRTARISRCGSRVTVRSAVPAPVLELADDLLDRVARANLPLAALDDRSASWVEEMRALVAAHDVDDAADVARVVENMRRAIAPFHPELAEPPATGPRR